MTPDTLCIPDAMFRHLNFQGPRILVVPHTSATRRVVPQDLVLINERLYRLVESIADYPTIAAAFQCEQPQLLFDGCEGAETATQFCKRHLRGISRNKVRVFHLTPPRFRRIATGERSSSGMCIVEVADAIYEVPAAVTMPLAQ